MEMEKTTAAKQQAEEQSLLKECYCPSDKPRLLYQGSRDGMEATTFHSLCYDNQGSTITVIQSSDNFSLGGFTSAPWSTSHGLATYVRCDKASLFTLRNPHDGVPSQRFPIIAHETSCAIYADPWSGPTFGRNNKLVTGIGGLIGNGNFGNFPNCHYSSFQDPTAKGNTLFTGRQTFVVVDIEVFAVP